MYACVVYVCGVCVSSVCVCVCQCVCSVYVVCAVRFYDHASLIQTV